MVMSVLSSPQGARYGIGAEGIWSFAYGANTSPKKLTGSRGITPFESHPGADSPMLHRFQCKSMQMANNAHRCLQREA